MPSKKQEFSFPGQTAEGLLVIAYGTFLELGWTPKYAGPNAVIGYTPRNSKKYDDEFVVVATDGSLKITSSLIHNESFDLMGKNKRHINDFITAFEKVKAAGVKEEWAGELEELRKQTAAAASEQEKQAEEINETMHLAESNLYVTYGIIAINAIVFILMAINGAGIFDADGYTQIKWGSNYTPLTLSGDWWRLITCMFIHFGIIHLAMNTYGLYTLGTFLEPMLGKVKFALAYLCTGVFASLASLWWHSEGVNSAGASGAIFGMFGIFLALLLTNLIPKQIRAGLLKGVGIIVVINLIYGMRAGVDNAAHVGGLLSGIIIGFIFYPLLKKENNKNKNNLALVGIAGVTILAAWLYFNSSGNKVSSETRQAELNYLKEINFPDEEKFIKKDKEYAEVEGRIYLMISKTAFNYSDWLKKYEEKINLELQRSTTIIAEMKTYNISDKAKKRLGAMEKFLDTRKEEVSVIKDLAREDTPANKLKMADIRNKQEEILTELKKYN